MPKTGFVIHNGIKQVFTTGPQTGNPVVNGYAINGTLQGPTVNYNQSFVEGSVETLSAGGQVWVRVKEDQTQCAPDCNAPTFSNISQNCSTNVFTLTSTNVNASTTPNTRIEVSTNNFSTILATFNRSNSNGNNNYSVDLSSLGIIRGTTIYFRLVNLCVYDSVNATSQPSEVKTITCEACCTPSFTAGTPTTDFFGFTSIVLTINLGTCESLITQLALETSTDNGATWYRTLIGKTTTHTITPFVTTKFRIQSICGGVNSEYSNVFEHVSVVTPQPKPGYTTLGPYDTSEIACTNGNLQGAVLGLNNISTDIVEVGAAVYSYSFTSEPTLLTGYPGWYAIAPSLSALYTAARLNTDGYIVEVGQSCSVVSGGDSGIPISIGIGSGPKIICDLLYRQGYLPKEIWEADEKFGRLMLKTNKKGMLGYLTWAKPVVKFLSENPQYSKYFYLITKPWSEHMAYQMGVLPKDNKLGKVIHYIGSKFSLMVYKFITSRRKRRKKQ